MFRFLRKLTPSNQELGARKGALFPLSRETSQEKVRMQVFPYFKRWLERWKLFALTLCLSCGSPETQFKDSEKAAPIKEAAIGKPKAENLRLFDAASFTIRIEGCSSGYTGTLTETRKSFNLYNNDWNCLGRLKRFVHLGKEFAIAPNKDFSTAQIGDTAIFVSQDQANFLTVRVTNQLSNPTRAGDSVNFAISESVESLQKIDILKTIFGSSGGMTKIREKPLRFIIRSSQLLQVVPATGAAQMAFKLECEALLENPNTSNAACQGVRLIDLKYVLVEDKSNGVPCPKTTQQCDKFFATGSTRVESSSGDIIAPGTSGLRNGGFRTKIDTLNGLIGPSDMAHHPNMLLIITDGISYQWFNVDIKVSGDFYLTQIALIGMDEE